MSRAGPPGIGTGRSVMQPSPLQTAVKNHNRLAGCYQAPRMIPERSQSLVEPVTIRLPKGGTLCPYTGLARTAMDQLVRPQECNNFNPPVVSRILRAKGQKRGIRLIDYRSLVEYLNSLPTEAKEGAV